MHPLSFSLLVILAIRELVKTFELFSKFSILKPNILKYKVPGILKPNILKYKVPGISSLKGVKMAVYGIKCTDLTIETIKILGVHFSYNQTLQTQKSFKK